MSVCGSVCIGGQARSSGIGAYFALDRLCPRRKKSAASDPNDECEED
jgi:hypothetical protein